MRYTRVVDGGMQRPRAIGVWLLRIEIVEQDEVEIGSGGHLARAELAHRDHAGTAARNPAVLFLEFGFDLRERHADDGFGKRAVGRAGLEWIEPS